MRKRDFCGIIVNFYCIPYLFKTKKINFRQVLLLGVSVLLAQVLIFVFLYTIITLIKIVFFFSFKYQMSFDKKHIIFILDSLKYSLMLTLFQNLFPFIVNDVQSDLVKFAFNSVVSFESLKKQFTSTQTQKSKSKINILIHSNEWARARKDFLVFITSIFHLFSSVYSIFSIFFHLNCNLKEKRGKQSVFNLNFLPFLLGKNWAFH